MRQFGSVTGFVIAGGRSSRMGRPKATLVLGGETTLELQLRRLGRVTPRRLVIGPAESLPETNVPVISDDVPSRGPLAGIVTALAHTRTEFNLCIGCDLPLLQARLLEYLVRRAVDSGADVTVPASPEHRLQPLCAVYRRQTLRVARTCLAAGSGKVRELFVRVATTEVTWPELARAGFQREIFFNMNTPEDYERAKRRLESRAV